MAITKQENFYLDIDDPEAFVISIINNHISNKVPLNKTIREELVQQGLLILTNMRTIYEPGKNGLDPTNSKFSGYAIKFLPNKMRDALHRLEGHSITKDDDNKRKWEEPDFNSIYSDDNNEDNEWDEDNEDKRIVSQLQTKDTYCSDIEDNVSSALDKLWEQEKKIAISVGVLLSEGYISNKKIKETLGIRQIDLDRSKDLIARSVRFLATV